MASVNKVILIGNLGNDPEVKYTSSGSAVANFSVATNDKWKDKQTEEWQERTEWHRVVFFGRQAEIVGKYLRKGSSIYIEGKLQTDKWTDKNDVERYTTKVIGLGMQMLGGREDNMGTGGDTSNNKEASNYTPPEPPKKLPDKDFDEDVPF